MKRKRTYMLLAGAVAGVLGGAVATGASAGAPRGSAGAAATVQLRHTRLGAILTSASGLTLYEFTRDHGSEDSCVKIKECATFWPPLKVGGKPRAGAGVKASLLSTVGLPGGGRQVTYDGHPLYTYIDDTSGSTGYVGAKAFGGFWYALSASGGAVK